MKKQDVAVILTVKDDAIALKKTLQSLTRQTLLSTEVIIAVAFSSDATWKVAEQWSKKFPFIRLFSVGNATRSVGRNRAVQEAKSSVYAFTDAGCVPKDDWLEKLVGPLLSGKAALSAGLTVGDPQNAWEAAQIPFVLVPASQTEKHPLPATRNMAVSREGWRQIGPFREDLNFAEDYEWSRRARQLGVHAMFIPDAVVMWRPRQTWLQYSQMIVRLTQGDMRAGTWRLGHATMIERYLFFFLVLGWGSVFFSPAIGVALGLSVWILYLLMKAIRFQSLSNQEKAWALGIQAVTDGAVIWGILSGLALRWQKADNRTT